MLGEATSQHRATSWFCEGSLNGLAGCLPAVSLHGGESELSGVFSHKDTKSIISGPQCHDLI